MKSIPKRVLIVEDDGPTSATMRETLLTWGFDVDTASDGSLALEKIREKRYDVAILDLMLPDSDAVLLQQRIQQSDPSLSSRLIFTTGFTDQQAVVEYLRRAGRGFLAKPFRPMELIEAVRKVLDSPSLS